MTKEIERELMGHVETIRKYPKGYEFTIPYYKMTTPQINAMNWVTDKAIELGLIRSISISHSLEDLRGESGRFCSEETFIRR